MPGWVNEAWQEYSKRLPRKFPLELIEVAPEGRQGLSSAKAMAGEAERIRAARRDAARLIALDERGRRHTSRSLAERLESGSALSQPWDVIIGGADGLDPGLKAEADESWSLSDLTLPHAMVRVLLAEQIYRAWSINQGHPYHRD